MFSIASHEIEGIETFWKESFHLSWKGISGAKGTTGFSHDSNIFPQKLFHRRNFSAGFDRGGIFNSCAERVWGVFRAILNLNFSRMLRSIRFFFDKTRTKGVLSKKMIRKFTEMNLESVVNRWCFFFFFKWAWIMNLQFLDSTNFDQTLK